MPNEPLKSLMEGLGKKQTTHQMEMLPWASIEKLESK